MGSDPDGFQVEDDDMAYWAYKYAYKYRRNNVSSLVNDLEIRLPAHRSVRGRPAIGFVLADQLHGRDARTFVMLSDG